MVTIASIMEMLMVVCFGVSWPLNIIKAWKARTARGSSLLFYACIWLGYVFALVGKCILIAYYAPQPWYVTVKWYVMLLYIVNTLMVTVGILVCLRNRTLDKLAERKAEKAAK